MANFEESRFGEMFDKLQRLRDKVLHGEETREVEVKGFVQHIKVNEGEKHTLLRLIENQQGIPIGATFQRVRK